jgi:site-specific DNA-cytosine methylase
LELFSGCGRHGEIVTNTLKHYLDPFAGLCTPFVNLIRIDIKKKNNANPELVADLLHFNMDHVARLKKCYPNKCWVVLASPPCQTYSKANTTGDTSPEALIRADQHVIVAQNFIVNLDAYIGILENPATGLLKNRKVRFHN